MAHGLKSQNFFPAIGANGPCVVHVNLGQAGFVFLEANVKKWGLAPVTGSLAPPPPYGSEQGSILLAAGNKDGYTSTSAPAHGHSHSHSHSHSVHTYSRHTPHSLNPGHIRSASGNFRVMPPTSPGPARSPTDISLAQLVPTDDNGEPSNSTAPGDQHHHHHHEIVHPNMGLGLRLQHPHQPPPPEYTSPDPSDSGRDSRRSSTDSENMPLINVIRSRGTSSATTRPINTGNAAAPPTSPPIPSYSDAVRQGAGRDRSDSSRSSGRGSSSED